MNEQKIRDDERRKIVEFIEHVAQELRSVDREYDAGFLDAIISKLSHPNWVRDTAGH
jgi:hypothetical protein